ncbi:MAG: hypothetical protein IPO78_17205 [Saprospiraceae bacterium]|nr:hypothetical protein [Saprospiraceae bacterium]
MTAINNFDFLNPENNDLNTIPKTGIIVDASCMGNPGVGQYRVYSLTESKVLYQSGYFENVTNNQMEALAALHAIAKHHEEIIYTDSQTAKAWIENKCISTSSNNHGMNARILAGLEHIKSLSYTLRLWQTRIWGENPADFGRKNKFRNQFNYGKLMEK